MRALLPLLLLLAALPAGAQTMYRSTMPDGRTVLSDRPMAGAVKVEEIVPPAGNVVPSQPAAAPAKPVAKPRPPDPLAVAEAELKEAQLAYDRAREARDQGREEQPGERLGVAGKGSRLSDAYWARQKSLEEAVNAAQRRLDLARERFNALR